MESVAQVVSDMIGQKINMSVPEVSLMSYDELARICTCDIDEPSIGVQVKMSGNIEGYVALFFLLPALIVLLTCYWGGTSAAQVHTLLIWVDRLFAKLGILQEHSS